LLGFTSRHPRSVAEQGPGDKADSERLSSWTGPSPSPTRRAVEAGFAPRAFPLTQRWLCDLADLVDETGAPALVVEDEVLTATTGFPVHRGALACMDRRPPPSFDRGTVLTLVPNTGSSGGASRS
jgi:hypothetical protein